MANSLTAAWGSRETTFFDSGRALPGLALRHAPCAEVPPAGPAGGMADAFVEELKKYDAALTSRVAEATKRNEVRGGGPAPESPSSTGQTSLGRAWCDPGLVAKGVAHLAVRVHWRCRDPGSSGLED
jgi:hypothetical protein